MQEIITEILERQGFPTKDVEELVVGLEDWSLDSLVALSVITNDIGIIAYRIGESFNVIPPKKRTHNHYLSSWRYCSLGSELVARLKGGE